MIDATTGFKPPPKDCAEGHDTPKWMPGYRPCSCTEATRRGRRGHRVYRCLSCLDGPERVDTVVLDPPCSHNG